MSCFTLGDRREDASLSDVIPLIWFSPSSILESVHTFVVSAFPNMISTHTFHNSR